MDTFAWHKRATASIAQGYLTNSKSPHTHIFGVYPTHIRTSVGCKITDSNSKQYTDYICGLGTNLLGYANPYISQAIASRLNSGICPSFATTGEVMAAEKLKEFFPFVDTFKFLKTGTEACAAAVRIARAATGRFEVLTEGYHGWSDGFVSLTPPAVGCPSSEAMGFFNLKDRKITKDTACVIVEPVQVKYDKENVEKLRSLRKRCDEVGALLIFDEVITGFRYRNHGVSNTHGVLPDLIVLGKALANGMPLSAVGGKKDIMNDIRYFVSSTFAGDTLSLAACFETLNQLSKKYNIDELWGAGNYFLKNFNLIANGVVKIEGYPARGVFTGDALKKALFFQECCKAGILFGPSWFFNFPLMAETDKTLNTVSDVCIKITTGSAKLEGEPPQSPFSQRIRENA